MKENKKEFLYHAIEDIRDTIRSIDTKIFGLLVLLILPISLLDEIFNVYKNIISDCKNLGIILSIGFGVSWLISLMSSIKTVYVIDNPSNHIKSSNVNGFYYSGDIFDLNTFSFRGATANKTVEEYIQELKKDWMVTRELAFEQMKLVYIRDIKMKFQRIAIKSLISFILFGVVSWLIEKLL